MANIETLLLAFKSFSILSTIAIRSGFFSQALHSRRLSQELIATWVPECSTENSVSPER